MDQPTPVALWRQRLTACRFIEIKLSALRAVIDSPTRARSTFQENDRSYTCEDFVAWTLVFVREEGGWKIAEEKLAELAPTNGDVKQRLVRASRESTSTGRWSSRPAVSMRFRGEDKRL